jgi:hypothetical protein
MANPYFLMALLYLALALLTALDASLTSFQLLPWFNGLRWLRVHFITLGILTEVAFGVMPLLAAARLDLPRPKIRWKTWLTLNIGLVILLAGIPIVNQSLIFSGGTLIFVATILLLAQLLHMQTQSSRTVGPSRKFYVTGLAYFLAGILVGTGLWLGWSEPLRIQIPIEVHIHANNWGFLSLVFAGLLVDVIPQVTGHPLTSARSLGIIFWMMALGALGLVIGPWLGGALWATVPGLVLHLTATVWVVIAAARALFAARLARQPGSWHLITAYAWILAPVLIAPLILLKVPGFPGAGIEATAPQALVYGWVLQFGYALLPYFVRRFFLHEAQPQLGGHWISLLTVHIGSALVWASIFIIPYQELLHGAAYTFYVLSLLPIVVQLSLLMRKGVQRLEQKSLREQNA